LLDDRRDKPCKLGLLPSLLVRELDVDKIETVESMRLFNSAEHMHVAFSACVPLDHSICIDDGKLRFVCLDAQIVTGNDTDDGEERSGGFPAFRAAAGMVVSDVALETDNDLVGGAATV
jgi:hypothetical protein